MSGDKTSLGAWVNSGEMSPEEEIKQYEQQLEEVRIELRNEPEELELVEAEVLGLINELKERANLQTSKGEHQPEPHQESHQDPKEEPQKTNGVDSRNDAQKSFRIDEQSTNKIEDQAIESERIRDTESKPAQNSAKEEQNRISIETSTVGPSELPTETPEQAGNEQAKLAPDPYEANRSKWKSFSGRINKRKTRR